MKLAIRTIFASIALAAACIAQDNSAKSPTDIPEGAELVTPERSEHARSRPADAPDKGAQSEESVQVGDRSLPFLLALPKGYDEQPDKKWSVVVFLHGAGERGVGLNRLKSWGPPRLIAEGEDLGAIVISPQCSERGWWNSELPLLVAMLDQVEKSHRVDADRIYLTGLSMGGYGTFAWAAHQPDRFAALVPICGGGDEKSAKAIAESGVPTWIFHGTRDNIVLPQKSIDMYTQIKDAGGSGEQVQLTLFAGVNHISWPYVYRDAKVWEWMFAQRRDAEQE